MANTEFFDICEAARKALADYCQACVHTGICTDEDDCAFCEVQGAYEILVEQKVNAHNIDDPDADDENDEEDA